MKAKFTAQEAINELWRRGILFWKLRAVQKKIYLASSQTNSLKYVVNSSRRLGKSYLICIQALENALQRPDQLVRLVAPTQKMLRNITHPLFRQIIADAPQNARPVWVSGDSKYICPSNGSEIYVAGANNGHADDSRGTRADQVFIDEAGFIDDLSYLCEDILMPQLLTTGGKLRMYSTPPRTPAHDFVGYAQRAMDNGTYSRFTIHESGYPKEIIEKFKEEAGGENSTTWKREYLCEFIVDEDFAIVPEWSDKFIGTYEPSEFTKFYQTYVGMDLGVVDKTIALFSTLDFKRGKLFIHDEIDIHGPKMTTDLLAMRIKEKERGLYGEKKVYQRVADSDNPLLLNDLSILHGINFIPVHKEGLDAMVNELRINVAMGRIIVDPKCKQLIGSLKFGVWNERRDKFERSNIYGHFDALAALVYLNRIIQWNENPIPALFGTDQNKDWINPEYERKEKEESLLKIVGLM